METVKRLSQKLLMSLVSLLVFYLTACAQVNQDKMPDKIDKNSSIGLIEVSPCGSFDACLDSCLENFLILDQKLSKVTSFSTSNLSIMNDDFIFKSANNTLLISNLQDKNFAELKINNNDFSYLERWGKWSESIDYDYLMCREFHWLGKDFIMLIFRNIKGLGIGSNYFIYLLFSIDGEIQNEFISLSNNLNLFQANGLKGKELYFIEIDYHKGFDPRENADEELNLMVKYHRFDSLYKIHNTKNMPLKCMWKD